MKRSRGAAILSLSLLLHAPLAAQETKEPATDEGVANALAALQAEFEATELASPAAYEAFQPRFAELAEKHAGTDAELGARLWLYGQAWWLRREKGAAAMNEEAGKHAERLLAEFGDSERLAELPTKHYVLSRLQKEELFSQLLEQSPHDTVRAAALYSLATGDLRVRDDEIRERGRRRFERLGKEFGELQAAYASYAEIADANLNKHDPADLEIGDVAPEIVGRDYEGNEMKLSNYRGQVVVLDFWGDW